MNHREYERLAPYYLRVPRPLNPIALDPANKDWMIAWWERRAAITLHVDHLFAANRFAEATAFLKANPSVRITEETVTQPMPAVIYEVSLPEPTEPEF